MRRSQLELLAGPGGWLEASIGSEGQPPESVWVRLVREDDGNWTLQGTLYAPGLTPESVRAVPLRRIVLAVAASEGVRNDLAARLDEAAPEPGSAEFFEAFTGWTHPEAEAVTETPTPGGAAAGGFPPLVLERPPGRRLSDEFYAKVAHTYRAAAARGLPPRTAIADVAGVSTEVAGRWVRQARLRGLLPDTMPGRVSV